MIVYTLQFLILWRDFVDENPRMMQINPPVVFTFTRQRWSNTTFRLKLA
jgi:hypothetical protein